MKCFGVGFNEGVGCQMYANVTILMHDLKPKCFNFVGFYFLEDIRGQMYDDI